MTAGQRIVSPMPTGSGAIVVHRTLEERLPDYKIVPYRPSLTYFPPLLRWNVPKPAADIIHTTPDHALFFKRPGIPLVSTFHNFVVDSFMQPYSTVTQRIHYATDLRYFLQKAVGLSDRLTAVSQFTADLAMQELKCDKPIEVIPNGVDTDIFSPRSDARSKQQLRVLFSGNPSRRKGAHWLPEIARRLGDSVKIVCASGLRGGWTQKLADAGIENLGRVAYESMPDLYRSVDALILPTVREGDSLAVLEAMSSGIPVVASACSSLPERIEHGEGGYLCDIGDVDGFVKAIENLRDPQLRHRQGEFNRGRAEKEFSLATMTGRYETLFADLR